MMRHWSAIASCTDAHARRVPIESRPADAAHAVAPLGAPNDDIAPRAAAGILLAKGEKRLISLVQEPACMCNLEIGLVHPQRFFPGDELDGVVVYQLLAAQPGTRDIQAVHANLCVHIRLAAVCAKLVAGRGGASLCRRPRCEGPELRPWLGLQTNRALSAELVQEGARILLKGGGGAMPMYRAQLLLVLLAHRYPAAGPALPEDDPLELLDALAARCIHFELDDAGKHIGGLNDPRLDGHVDGHAF
mmetsp:Transcript_14770/g.43364  ORF Transcript_14770/g.43364 Transcript_14770/m.43364 type:complete len:247 (+) Transcript_14770:67-807(+)